MASYNLPNSSLLKSVPSKFSYPPYYLIFNIVIVFSLFKSPVLAAAPDIRSYLFSSMLSKDINYFFIF